MHVLYMTHVRVIVVNECRRQGFGASLGDTSMSVSIRSYTDHFMLHYHRKVIPHRTCLVLVKWPPNLADAFTDVAELQRNELYIYKRSL